MRIATTLEILRRAALGHTVADIATALHLSRGIVQTVLTPSGYPDVELITAYREKYRAFDNREVWAAGDTLASLAATARVNPEWVHAATAEYDHQELRTLLAVAVAMLPEDLNVRDALAWAETGGKRGRPRKEAA